MIIFGLVVRDPQNVVDFAEALYGDSAFLGALYNGLSEDGVLVSQVGETVSMIDPAQTHSINRNRALFIRSMIEQGFVSIVEYDEVSYGWITVDFSDLCCR